MPCRTRILVDTTTWIILGRPQGVSVLNNSWDLPQGDYDLIVWTQWANDVPKILHWLHHLPEHTHVWLWMGEFINDWSVQALLDGIEKFDRVHLFCDNIWPQDLPKVTTMINWWTCPFNIYAPDGLCHHLLQKLTHAERRPKLFDCLLGRQRPHRDFIANMVADSDYQDRFIFTYYKEHIRRGIWDEPVKFAKAEGIATTVAWSQYQNVDIGSQFVIPWKIYNDSYYSIVAETGEAFVADFYVPTEKVGRPMVARRPFVMFGGAGSLRMLRKLGFRTFGAVIDESYDDIADNRQRWLVAWDQVEQLCQQDPDQVMQKLESVLLHNQQLIIERNWWEPMQQRFREFSQDYDIQVGKRLAAK